MAQARQKVQHNQHSRSWKRAVGDTVQVRNYSGTRNCLSGIIFEETAPVSAKVQLEDGIILRRHHNQLLARPTQPIEHQVSQPIPSELGSEDSSQVIPPVIVVPEPKTTTAWKNGFAHLCKWANMYQIWYLLEGKHGEDRIYLRTWANMVFTTFASDLLSCLLHLCSLVNLSKSIFSSSVQQARVRELSQ